MYLMLPSIFHPNITVCFYINLTYTIQCHNVKFPDRFIIFRWISRSHNHPSVRHLMTSKGLILQKLQHGRCQCLRCTVDLINKENAFFLSGLFHTCINRIDNLTHGIFCYAHFFSVIYFFPNSRKTNRTLSGMVRNGIRNQSYLIFFCHLFHNCSFSNSRRSHQKNRTLTHQSITIISKLIFFQISF